MTNNHQRHHLPETVDKEYGEIVHYEYDGCEQLSTIVYSDSTKVSYAYDKNGNLTTVTDWKER